MSAKKHDYTKILEWQKEEPVTLTYRDKECKEEIHIQVRKHISYVERLKLISEIAAYVFPVVDGIYDISNYEPAQEEFAVRFTILSYFTDLKLPTDAKVLGDLVMNTSLYDDVEKLIGADYLADIILQADQIIDTNKELAIKNNTANLLLVKIGDIMGKIGDKFKDINIDEIKNLMGKFKDINSDKIIETILNQNKENKNVGEN